MGDVPSKLLSNIFSFAIDIILAFSALTFASNPAGSFTNGLTIVCEADGCFSGGVASSITAVSNIHYRAYREERKERTILPYSERGTNNLSFVLLVVHNGAGGETEDRERGHRDRLGVWEGVYKFWIADDDLEFAPGELGTR